MSFSPPTNICTLYCSAVSCTATEALYKRYISLQQGLSPRDADWQLEFPNGSKFPGIEFGTQQRKKKNTQEQTQSLFCSHIGKKKERGLKRSAEWNSLG